MGGGGGYPGCKQGRLQDLGKGGRGELAGGLAPPLFFV